jgi:hypothetical protein
MCAQGYIIGGEGSCPHWEKPEWDIACLGWLKGSRMKALAKAIEKLLHRQ